MDFKLLFTFEISSDHHFQHLKELSVRDETVFVHVIDFECNLIMHLIIIILKNN